jgi:hypothetical protein
VNGAQGTSRWLFATGRFGSLAETHNTPKAAVRAAGIEAKADLAIRERQVLAGSCHCPTPSTSEKRLYSFYQQYLATPTSSLTTSSASVIPGKHGAGSGDTEKLELNSGICSDEVRRINLAHDLQPCH